MTETVVILCTAPNSDTAEHMASTLVEEQLAVCVTVLPGAISFYRWQGVLQCESEVQLIIKSVCSQQEAVLARLQSLHPYEVPELLVLPVTGGGEAYLNWIASSVA